MYGCNSTFRWIRLRYLKVLTILSRGEERQPGGANVESITSVKLKQEKAGMIQVSYGCS